eukprot:1330723-Prymnesium_polylepis.1
MLIVSGVLMRYAGVVGTVMRISTSEMRCTASASNDGLICGAISELQAEVEPGWSLVICPSSAVTPVELSAAVSNADSHESSIKKRCSTAPTSDMMLFSTEMKKTPLAALTISWGEATTARRDSSTAVGRVTVSVSGDAI